MNRRTFLCGLTLGTLSAPLAVDAQQAGKIPRLGVIVPVEPASPAKPNIGAFRHALRDLGYMDGQNVAVEYLYAHGKAELYAELAAKLVHLQVDVMVVGSGEPTLAAKKAQGVAGILSGVETPEQRKAALAQLDAAYKKDDTTAIFGRAQLEMQDDPK